MKIEERGNCSRHAPEVKVPFDGAVGLGTVGVQICERPVDNFNKIRRDFVFVFISQSHGPDAQRIDKEECHECPKNPKGTALVVRGIRGLRFGGSGFGWFRAHVKSLAASTETGKELAGAPEMEVPIENFAARGGLVHDINRLIENYDCSRRTLAFVEPGHGPNAQRIGEEQQDEAPKQPEGATRLAGCFRIVRIGLHNLAWRLAHARTIALLGVAGKEFGR